MAIKTALITGITGQDGALLAQYLLNLNYKILAPTRKTPDKSKLNRLCLGSHPDINFLTYSCWTDFDDIIATYKPNEIYHFAAMSHVGQSHDCPDMVFDVNTQWTIQILKAIEKYSRQTKMFFASSCEIFQNDLNCAAKVNSNKLPNNPYGISKLSAHLMVEYYRKVKGLFTCNGILFNHESMIRDDAFVSKKICREVARIIAQGGKPLYLGNIEAKKDWGYAPDYVKAFHSMLQQHKADDYVISTGVLHSVRDMVNAAFSALNYAITWQGKETDCRAINQNGDTVVAIDKKFFRPLDNRFLIGDNTKAKESLNFNNITPFETWVTLMVNSELKNIT